MTNTVRLRRAALIPVLAALLVSSIAVAPAAAATSNPVNCREGGGARVCQKQGHSSLHAKPQIRQPAGGLFHPAWLPGFGRGPMPPLLALD